MRSEERYWMKVSVTISIVVLALLILIILGLTQQLGHLYDSIVRLVE
jgi:hypothetical protein